MERSGEAAAFHPPSVPNPHVIPTNGRNRPWELSEANLSIQSKPIVIPNKEFREVKKRFTYEQFKFDLENFYSY
jgi:hypothetical protein